VLISPSSICQIEIPVGDVGRALTFYEAVFGWKRSPAEIQNYVVLDTGESGKSHMVGVALVPAENAGARSNSCVVYFACDEAEAVVERAVKAGGQKRFGPTKLPAWGQIWQICDPDGNRLGLFKRAAAESRDGVE
jgi:predicted enzyme related to lactoylglutathione lyase